MIAQFTLNSYRWSALAVILMISIALVGFTRATDSNEGSVNQDNSAQQKQCGKATFTIVRAKYQDGEWQCNPNSLLNLQIQIHVWLKDRIHPYLHVDVVDLADDKIFTVKPPFIYITGNKDFILTEKEVKNLRDYLMLGGALWADCSLTSQDKGFDIALRREMKKVLPDKSFDTVSLSHEMFNTFFDGIGLPPGINGSTKPVEIILIGNELGVLYTANGYGDLWEYRLDATGKIDSTLLREGDKETLQTWNISDATVVNAYKFGVNTFVYLLKSNLRHLIKFLPKDSAAK